MNLGWDFDFLPVSLSMARLVIDNRQTQQNMTDLRPVGAGRTIYHI
jgi:hypothetical protein